MFTSRIWDRGKKRRFFLLLVLAATAVYFLLGSTNRGGRGGSLAGGAGNKPPEAASTPVVATRTRRGDIGVYLNGLGAVTPVHTVTVKSRVDGELMQVFYREGDIVHERDFYDR
jgi:multidrug efflux system membrane fusion protein